MGEGFINSSQPLKFFAKCKVLYPHRAVLFQPSSAFLLRWLWAGRLRGEREDHVLEAASQPKNKKQVEPWE